MSARACEERLTPEALRWMRQLLQDGNTREEVAKHFRQEQQRAKRRNLIEKLTKVSKMVKDVYLTPVRKTRKVRMTVIHPYGSLSALVAGLKEHGIEACRSTVRNDLKAMKFQAFNGKPSGRQFQWIKVGHRAAAD
jgi:hypothetical protein